MGFTVKSKSIRAELHSQKSRKKCYDRTVDWKSGALKFEALVEKFKEQEKKGQDEEVQAI
jgi:hypothetical protein